jgi:CRP-like cAMP-binding protein
LAKRGFEVAKMTRSNAVLGLTANQLLASLPGSALSLIEPHFTSVLFAVGTIVHQVGDDVEQIYFPTDGIASLQMVMGDGRAIDTAMVGRDGAIGSLGAYRSIARCVVRSTMTAFRISAVKYGHAATENAAIQMLTVHYNDKLLSQTQNSAAHYACFSIDQRLATCLLDVSRRLASNNILLTQEALGEMLAVRRTSITEAATKLQSAGIVSYVRGRIQILDQARLIKLSQCQPTEATT